MKERKEFSVFLNKKDFGYTDKPENILIVAFGAKRLVHDPEGTDSK